MIGEKTAFGELEQELAFCEKDVCFILPFQLFPVFSTCHINADDFTRFSCLQKCALFVGWFQAPLIMLCVLLPFKHHLLHWRYSFSHDSKCQQWFFCAKTMS